MTKLTHFNEDGAVHMVDVAGKDITHRVAVAIGKISMRPQTLALIQSAANKKGDVLGIARTAGIMAAKKTPELVPLCHPINLTHADISLEIDEANPSITCVARTETDAKTGVEMEALAAVQITLLTIYDMCKATDRGMTMSGIKLLEKSGGKSGTWAT